jgi:hypothetical protein
MGVFESPFLTTLELTRHENGSLERQEPTRERVRRPRFSLPTCWRVGWTRFSSYSSVVKNGDRKRPMCSLHILCTESSLTCCDPTSLQKKSLQMPLTNFIPWFPSFKACHSHHLLLVYALNLIICYLNLKRKWIWIFWLLDCQKFHRWFRF